MSRIDDENAKTLRPALDVIVGMDVPSATVSSVSATNNYPGTSGTVNGSPERVVLMDLIGDGFQNDGSAQPLSTGVTGYLSSKGSALTITVTLDAQYDGDGNEITNDDDLVVIYYTGGVLSKMTVTGSGTTRTATIPASNDTRYRIARAIVGNAWWYDNDTLISCNVSLRAVETKLDNPQLQMSEIEFTGYEPNDITNKIGSIGTEYPIYYTAGFYGDMSPVRQFYLGEQLKYGDKKITIHGYDATYKLDDTFGGAYTGNASDNISGGGIGKYFDAIKTMITNAGVACNYNVIETSNLFNVGAPFLLPKIPKRQIIAQAANMYRVVAFYYPDEMEVPIFWNYVDAGIPTITIGKPTMVRTITDITKPEITVEPVIATLIFNRFLVEVAASNATIETRQVTAAQIVETTDPYYSFSASGATVSKITPYKYKLVPSAASCTISGRKIYLTDDGSDNYIPLTYSTGRDGIAVTLPDVDGPYAGFGGSYGVPIWDVDYPEALQYLISRSNILYTFDFRGDPRLQPRDYIRADIDGTGTLVDMTIDSIDIRHENGGTTSTITARRGFI